MNNFILFLLWTVTSVDVQQLEVNSTLVISEAQNWGYYLLSGIHAANLYMSIELKLTKASSAVLAVRNNTLPIFDDSNSIRADWIDLDNYYLNASKHNVIISPNSYSSDSLYIGVYTNSLILQYSITTTQSFNRPCINGCSNKGICESGRCICFTNYIGKDCNVLSERITLNRYQYLSIPSQSYKYFYYLFDSSDNYMNAEVMVSDSHTDKKEVSIYTKPSSGYATVLPTESDFYKKISGSQFEFNFESKSYERFYFLIENSFNSDANLRFYIYNDEKDDENTNQPTFYIIIALSSAVIIGWVIFAIYKSQRSSRAVGFIENFDQRAIEISCIEENYPAFNYDPKKSKEFLQCAICLENLSENDKLRKLWCDHMYHKRCIDMWFSTKIYCCVCKRDCKNLETTRGGEDNSRISANGILGITFSENTEEVTITTEGQRLND